MAFLLAACYVYVSKCISRIMIRHRTTFAYHGMAWHGISTLSPIRLHNKFLHWTKRFSKLVSFSLYKTKRKLIQIGSEFCCAREFFAIFFLETFKKQPKSVHFKWKKERSAWKDNKINSKDESLYRWHSACTRFAKMNFQRYKFCIERLDVCTLSAMHQRDNMYSRHNFFQ